MRVAYVIDSLTWGGAETLLADLLAVVPAIGVEPSVTYLADLHGSPVAPLVRRRGVEPVLVGVPALADPRSLLRVRRRLRSLRPDLVHTHLGYADLLGGPAARSLGLPSVSTLHLMEWERHGKEGFKERLMALARRHGAHRVIAVSEAARRAYLATGWDRPDRVVCVPNGIARDAASGTGRAVRAELGLGADDLVCAMVTVLRRGKGHEAAAAAVRGLRERYPSLRLLVCGEGPDRAHVEAALAGVGGVVMAGHRTDVMEVLDAVDVLLHPTHADAFPTTLLEAAAAGVPVVATAVGGVPEIVVDGTTGVLVGAPPDGRRVAAALAPLLEDPGLRRRMGAAAQERFGREYSGHIWARRLGALYEEALR